MVPFLWGSVVFSVQGLFRVFDSIEIPIPCLRNLDPFSGLWDVI